MCEDLIIESEQNIEKSGHCDSHLDIDPRASAFLALINHHVDRDSRPLSAIAKILKISRRQLGRMLNGHRPMRIAELLKLTEVLRIDPARAVVAIEVIGDWQCYDDPGLGVVMHLLYPVVTRLRARADFAIQPLTKPAQDRLSDWLADTIITNEEQIRNRRDTFMKLPEI